LLSVVIPLGSATDSFFMFLLHLNKGSWR
jgi:hypothetical protein